MFPLLSSRNPRKTKPARAPSAYDDTGSALEIKGDASFAVQANRQQTENPGPRSTRICVDGSILVRRRQPEAALPVWWFSTAASKRLWDLLDLIEEGIFGSV